MNIDGKTVQSALTLGLGRSGQAATELLLAEGVETLALDCARSEATQRAARALRRKGARVRLGDTRIAPQWLMNGGRATTQGNARPFDVCVVSPGLAPNNEWIRQVEAVGIPTIAELELGALHCRCPLIAITGSNGKSTATRLCAQALQQAGLRAIEAGNCGYPLSAAVLEHPDLERIAVEVSSFQLERTTSFRPRVGILLNIQPDHLDRHGGMAGYRRVKLRLFANMGKGDTAIAPAADIAAIRAEVRLANPRADEIHWVGFGMRTDAELRIGRDASLQADNQRIALRGTPFGNSVMAASAAAVGAALRACGLDWTLVRHVAESFEPLPHRFQTIREIAGVRFVDDSKATNLAALQAALRMTSRPVHLIAGGRLKEKKLDNAKEALAKRVKTVYCIGESGLVFAEAWKDSVPCRQCGNLENAVHAAARAAQTGDMVLLAPGCASFDQFRDFKERGLRFAEAVHALDASLFKETDR